MAVTTTQTNKPLNPRGNDQSPKGYNRAELYSGKALDFDGTNDELSLDGFTMSGDTATLSFCLKADDWDANSFIFAAGTPEIVIGSTTGGNNLSFYDSSSWQTFGAISDTTSTNFFSIVFDGTSAIAYMNGVKFGETLTITAIDLSSVTGVKLMAKYTGGAWFFNGAMSGFKIFNTALTAAQVADLYNNPEKVVPTGVDNTALKLWLPMQEGAGTTAYDGSGNGNHGAVSGASWLHGIGAPVSQTAVIDWNKGTNLFEYSEQFNQGSWTKFSSTLTSGQNAPDGSDNAYKIVFSDPNAYIQNATGSLDTSSEYTISCWVKSDGADTDFRIGNISAGSFETRTATSEWQRFEVTQTPSGPTRYPRPVHPVTGSETLYIWGAQLEKVSSAGAYIPNHTNTAITSPVLLPQGLTSGRDITGVNLFENVRKQGALNLDGNSWAEVHDNASLDITDEITLEAWVYDTDEGTFEGVIGKWKDSTERTYAIIKNNGSNNFLIRVSIDGSAQAGPTITNTDYGWIHLVLVYDGANVKGYKNGVYQSQSALTGSIATNDKPVEIGRYGQNSNTCISSSIAQPRIYNRALTAEEVQRNYNAGKNIYK